ncbi:hypothetical protein [Chitinimonas prasina]|nr:hypothetical protein [Chitinimonas prasina]
MTSDTLSPPKRRPGRPAHGERAMTPAERQRASRKARRALFMQEIKAGKGADAKTAREPFATTVDGTLKAHLKLCARKVGLDMNAFLELLIQQHATELRDSLSRQGSEPSRR